MNISIVIPAYNEETAIRAGKLTPVYQQAFLMNAEVIVVDDGSTDGTFAAIAEVSNKERREYVYRTPHQGKAGALISGMRMALGDLILCADLDGAVEIGEVYGLLAAIQAGADVAIGSRGLQRPGAPVDRLILSAGQVVLKRLLLGIPWVDTQCGFKLWTRTAAMHCIDHLVIYNRHRLGLATGANVASGFDVEMLLIARRLGYRVADVPVIWRYQHSRRVTFTRDARRGLADLWRIFAAQAAGLYPSAPAQIMHQEQHGHS